MNKKTFQIILISGVIIVTVFVVFLFIAPKMVNSDFVRNRICGYVSTETGGRLEYDRLGVSYFPRFGLTLYGASLRLPHRTSLSFQVGNG